MESGGLVMDCRVGYAGWKRRFIMGVRVFLGGMGGEVYWGWNWLWTTEMRIYFAMLVSGFGIIPRLYIILRSSLKVPWCVAQTQST